MSALAPFVFALKVIDSLMCSLVCAVLYVQSCMCKIDIVVLLIVCEFKNI